MSEVTNTLTKSRKIKSVEKSRTATCVIHSLVSKYEMTILIMVVLSVGRWDAHR